MATIALKVGNPYEVYGKVGTIRKVWPFGTIDVEMPSGKFFRVTGLRW